MNTTEPAVPQWIVHSALGFVILTLIALVVIPMIGEGRITATRDALVAVGEPARRLVRDVQAGHAREMSALRGFAITEMEAFLDRYESQRSAVQAAYEEMEPLVLRLGPDVRTSYEELVAATQRWHAAVDETGMRRLGIVPPDYIDRMPFEDALYAEVLEAAGALDQAIIEQITLGEEQLREAVERRQSLTAWLIMLALLAVLVVAWFAHRLFLLAAGLDHRAREEAAFRYVAETLSAAIGIDEAMSRLARSSLDAIGGAGAFIERVQRDANQIEIASAAGTATPKLRALVPYPDSLTQLMVERNEPEMVSEMAAVGPLVSPYLGRACDQCSILATLLQTEDGEPLGALVLLRPPDQAPFQAEDRPRARVLANLASLALRRGIAMEELEGRREEVERLMASKSQLMRGLSHDLKNPIGNVDGYVRLLEEEVGGKLSTEQHECVSGIRRATQGARAIIEDVLELARAEVGQLRIDRRTVMLGEIVRQLVEDQRPAADAAGVDLEVSVPEGLPQIETDPERVRQILGNLVSNAVKYTSERDKVVVSALRRDEDAPRPGTWIAVDVADHGPGIPPEDRERIFDEFYRLESGKEGGGTGLGLAIAQRIARLLGGDVTLRSSVGEGSTFTLWLPITGVDAQSRAA